MLNLLSLFGKKRWPAVKSQRRAQLWLETLEDRNCPSGAPTAIGDSYYMTHDDTLVTTLSAPGPLGVLANDSDPESDPLTVTDTTDPEYGTLSMNGDGTFTYTPNAGWTGIDAFDYTVSDGTNSSTATVDITVTNTPPNAIADYFSTLADGDITGNVLSNDSDADGDALTASLDQDAANGTVTVQADGTFSYTPDAGFLGTDSFTYFADDGVDQTSAQVTVDVAMTGSGATGLTGLEGSVFNEVLGTFTVSEAFPSSQNYSATIDWGDGSSTSTGTLTDIDNSTFEVSGSHTYADDGNYTITVTITDHLGNSIDFTTTPAIANVQPSLVLSGAGSTDELSVYTLTWTVTDPGDDAETLIEIDWGDGQGAVPYAPGYGGTGDLMQLYSTPGQYNITAWVTDEDGRYASANSLILNVVNVKPEILDLTHTMLSKNKVRVTGSVWDAQNVGLVVNFTGVITTTATVQSDGTFSVDVDASALGNFTANVTDPGGLAADPVTRTITSAVPVITNFTATHASGNWWTFSGIITDESPEDLYITLTGTTSTQNVQIVVASDGTFALSILLEPDESGTVTASLSDWWGQAATPVQVFVDN